MNLLVIVPVYNEWPHIMPILTGLRERFSHILVVDDGSMETLIREPFLNLDYQDLGVLFMARKEGLLMAEVSVQMAERAGEKSKVFRSIQSVFRYLFVTLTFILVRRL